MSDPRYAPYGVDDDPFLTHPAGPGQGQMRANEAFAHTSHSPMRSYGARHASVGQPQRGFDAMDVHAHRQAHEPAQDYGAYDQRGDYDYSAARAPHYGHFDPAPYENAAFVPPQPMPQPLQQGARFRGDYEHPAVRRAPPLQQAVAQQAVAQQAVAQQAVAQQVLAQSYGSFAAPPRSPAQARPAPTDKSANQSSYHPAHESPEYNRAYAPQRAPYDDAPHAHDYGDVQAGAFGPTAAQLTQWAGALCTVITLIGAGYWGYALAVRDANGIPVVRAAEGPLRVAPETPGGDVSAHQGLAVNAIPAAGTAPDMPEQIMLAPQMDRLRADDVNEQTGAAALVESGSFADPEGAGSSETLAGASDQVLSNQVLTAPQTGGGIDADLTALPDSLPEEMPFTDADAVERALEMALAEGGDFASAEAAPIEAVITPVSLTDSDPILPPTSELDPATIALGTPLAQLGAFDTPETARAEWANLQTRFTELMAGKALVVEPAKSGGRDFYRLRAHGFESADDSRRFCAAILAENGSCFPVDQR
jgi:hypothetical protein